MWQPLRGLRPCAAAAWALGARRVNNRSSTLPSTLPGARTECCYHGSLPLVFAPLIFSFLPPTTPSAEDRGILDERGNLAEDEQDVVLENILAVSGGWWGVVVARL